MQKLPQFTFQQNRKIWDLWIRTGSYSKVRQLCIEFGTDSKQSTPSIIANAGREIGRAEHELVMDGEWQ